MKITQFAILLLLAPAMASSTETPAPTIPFTESNWTTTLAENQGESRIETVAGREALLLHNGRLDLKGVEFETGVVEFDILTEGERGFGGLRWRVQADGVSYEEFYIRPHMSGKPDANQYTPVFGGVSGWQIYFGPQYSAPVRYKIGEWMHVRIVVAETQAAVYIDSDEPVLLIDDLRGKFGPGGLALSAGFAPFYFTNFSYRAEQSPILHGQAIEHKPLPPHLVKQFSVSGAFPEALVAKTSFLPTAELPADWSRIEVENNGAANLARTGNWTREANTVIARLKIRSGSDTVKLLQFGYSDRVRVFHNGKALYSGNNGYRTRDYRYLGTVGLFDQLYLQLVAGDNIVDFAVSESFGGWGIMARLEDMEGLELVQPTP